MISLWAIIKLTARAALRSYVFQLLLAILMLSAFLVPATISGDGTAYGFIQISLQYSLGVTAFILSLSTVWLGCFSLSRDIESYQIHTVVSKPVSRSRIWLGKWLGILLIHATLLLLSATVIYTIIQWQFGSKNFKPEEKDRIMREVMVSRKVTYPEIPDINAMARAMLRQRLELLKQENQKVEVNEAEALADMRKKAMAGLSEVKPGPANAREWEFKNIPKIGGEILHLRFRMYVNKISSKDQRISRGIWFVFMDTKTGKKNADGSEEVQPAPYPTSEFPVQYMTGVFHELKIPSAAVLSDNSIKVTFINFDPENKPLFFQVSDGPKLLSRAGGFLQNYFRAVAVIFMRLAILAGIACAAGGLMSMPTAVFLVFSYLLAGIFAEFLVGPDATPEGIMGHVGYWVSKALLLVVIPMQRFEVSNFISNGELIEMSLIGTLFVKYFIFKALPIFIIGVLLYRRRELGLVVRK